MRKIFFTVLGLLAACALASAQVNYAVIEARGSVLLENSRPRMSADYANIHIKGDFAPSVHFRWRQRLTKPLYDASNPLNATDILSLTWDITEKWTVSAGKLPIYIGGYEWDDAPIDVYYWNGFCNRIQHVYSLGGSVAFHPAAGQEILLQVVNSPLHGGNLSLMDVGLGWLGQVAPWWKTLWSVNLIDDPYHHMMGYVSLGNRFEAGPLALELDVMYRRSLKQANAQFDGSIGGRLEYRPSDKWQLFAKGGWDGNDDNIDPDGVAYDLTVPPGTQYWYGGGGVEFFPLGNDKIRLHAVAWTESETRLFSASVGLTFRFHFVK